MRKVISLSMLCFMALSVCTIFSCTKEPSSNGNGSNGGNSSGNGEYVDLELPSGTMWKNANEVNAADAEYDFYTYDEAVAAFGDALPTKEQLEELQNNCQWTWNDSGYTVTGPNGHSIVLPAAGYRSCCGSVFNVGSSGLYWSSVPCGSEYAWSLYFDSVHVNVGNYYRCYGYSVRLVQD